MALQVDEDWDFDTIRTNPHSTFRHQGFETIRGGRSVSNSSHSSDFDEIPISVALQSLALNSAPHSENTGPSRRVASPSPSPSKPTRAGTARRRSPPNASPNSARREQLHHHHHHHRHITKESQVLHNDPSRSPSPEPQSHTAKSTSTVRPVRRVSEKNNRPGNATTSSSTSSSSTPSTGITSQPSQPSQPPDAQSLYNSIIHTSLAQLTTNTSAAPQEHLAAARLSSAWSSLNEVNPEASILLLRSMLDQLQRNPALNALVSPTSQSPLSPRPPPPPPPTARKATPAKAPELLSSSPAATGSPLARRKRRSSVVSGAGAGGAGGRRRGGSSASVGMEETAEGKGVNAVLADVLYGRWVEGLRERWGSTER
ncbi:hypothetical protein B9Z19DRAFT_148938 [Tuber borchii]|uniref:Uncharacterized protein n=1 Tax=Tuber borchii TaxID=42251 RepID=A0A2T6ZQ99_TUBBO|nr:hypothetical protein B9Z19DRAFT_148938 [Tuber borchii]